MSKKSKIIVGIIVCISLIGILFGFAYNNLIDQKNQVNVAVSNIDTQLQRRSDLIPNLVNTVKSYTKHETKIYENIAKANSALINAKTLQEKDEANNKLTNAINGWLTVVTKYPEIKSDKEYINLMNELSGTENRLMQTRRQYNVIAGKYNSSIEHFPMNLFANGLGFKQVYLFKTDESSQKAPVVNIE